MKRFLWLFGAALVAGTSLLGQGPGPGPCCGAEPTVLSGIPIVELKGKVARVQISPGGGMPFVETKDGNEVWTVYLGSMRYLMMQGFNPKVDEDIVAKAYKTQTAFIAASVTLPSENKTVRLRDENGRPVWRGGPRGNWMR